MLRVQGSRDARRRAADRGAHLVVLALACFWLQGPVCAVACSDLVGAANGAEPVAAASMACHEAAAEEPASSPPPTSPESHEDCSCADLDREGTAWSVSSAPPAASQVAAATLAPQRDPSLRDARHWSPERMRPRPPPPDILLLTTTLLI